jgi:hypothetical protein
MLAESEHCPFPAPGATLFVADVRLVPRGLMRPVGWLLRLAYRLFAGATNADVLSALRARFDRVALIGPHNEEIHGDAPWVFLAVATTRVASTSSAQ